MRVRFLQYSDCCQPLLSACKVETINIFPSSYRLFYFTALLQEISVSSGDDQSLSEVPLCYYCESEHASRGDRLLSRDLVLSTNVQRLYTSYSVRFFEALIERLRAHRKGQRHASAYSWLRHFQAQTFRRHKAAVKR
jgi:hypothetical protein